MSENTETKAAAKYEPRFPKRTLVRSVRYRDKVDLINAFLAEGKLYTYKEVDAVIDKFMKGKVV